MKCDQCQSELTLLLLGELPPEQADVINDHLATGCQACNAAFAELCDTLDELGQCLVDHPSLPNVDAELRQRLQAERESQSNVPLPTALAPTDLAPAKRLFSSTDASTQRSTQTGQTVRRQWMRYGLVAACAASIGFVLARLMPLPTNGTKSAVSDRATSQETSVGDPTEAQPRLISMQPATNAGNAATRVSAARGYAIWDPIARQVHFHCQAMSAPDEGTRYVAWLHLRDGRWVQAGTLPTDTQGNGAVAFELPDQPLAVQNLAITLESTGKLAESPSGLTLVSSDLLDESGGKPL